jgi:hypothetical protein
MRIFSCFSLAAALLSSSAAYAQQITIGGWVQRVDAASASITIRTLHNPRTISVAPNAVIRVNGAAARLDQLPFNSSVSIIAEKDPNGVLRATQIVAQPTGREPAAVESPGAIVRGTLVGIDVPSGTITVRTSAGDYPVTLGTASIYANGARGSSRDLHLGQTVEVVRTLPTAASTDYVTETVRVFSPAGQAAGTAVRPAPPRRGAAGAGTATGGAAASPAGAASAAVTTGAGLVDRGGTLYRTRSYGAVSRTPSRRVTSRTADYRHTYRVRRVRYTRIRRTRSVTRYTRTRRTRRRSVKHAR